MNQGGARVEVTGPVTDLKSYLSGARVMAVPLKRGAGVQNKVLDALACGLPVVATSLAGEGLGLKAGVEYLKADSTAEFAEGLGALLTDDSLAGALASAGRAKVEKEFTWEKQWIKLDGAIQRCAGSKRP